MKLKLALTAIVFLVAVASAHQQPPAIDSGAVAVQLAWPANSQVRRLSDIGRGKAIVFSPDLAAQGNREFYERLGFFYIENSSWQKVLNKIIARNYWRPEDRVGTVLVEAHGTNGNGLKLQAGPSRTDARSYISIAAIQEKLAGLGVRTCVIAACNAGRLLRPGTYRSLGSNRDDRLFLPATLGIINASAGYDPRLSKVTVVRRAESRIETNSHGNTSEFSLAARKKFEIERPGASTRVSRKLHFVVSNLLIQMLIRDPRLKLVSTGYAREKSIEDLTDAESETLFRRFVSYINDVAARE